MYITVKRKKGRQKTMFTEKQKIYTISAKLPKEDIEAIKLYIQGAVDGFCNNRTERFSVLKLFGGENRDWHGTPLQKIYDYHDENKAPNPWDSSRRDAGWLLLTVLQEDERWYYEKYEEYHGNEYCRK